MRNLAKWKRRLALLAMLGCALAQAETARAGAGITSKVYGLIADQDIVTQYTLTNPTGASVSILDYGGTVTNLMMPDKSGALGDVVLGCTSIAQYQNESPYFGALVGRTANRIAKGIFTIDQQRYCVAVNNGPDSLHGGFKGYDKRIWNVESGMTTDGPSLRLTLVDPDGTDGFPGTVKVTVIYSLTPDDVLKVQYFATSDKATPINLTNHTYFNLKDGGASGVDHHVLQLFSDSYTPVDAVQIPTGEIVPVKGTPFDFTSPKPIGQDLAATGGEKPGYDHNYVLRNQDETVLAEAAAVYEPDSGRVLQVWTTQPGVQLYTGNFLDGTVKGKGGVAYQMHSAFCLETQHYPDSVNHPKFPDSVLRPGEVYREITEYRFSTSDHQP